MASNNTPLCPVKALREFTLVHPTKGGPLFVFQNGTFLTRKTISQLMKVLIPDSITKTYSSHSFRIGAATTAAGAGFPRWLIQSLGRWSSDCFKEYIRIPDSTIEQV